MAVTISEAIMKTREDLSKLTGLGPSSTLGVSKNKEGWHVSIEMVEKHSIPDSMDILGLYEVQLDDNGNIVKFNRTKLRKRIDVCEDDRDEGTN